MFCAFELLDSPLSSSSTFILDPAAIEFCCVGVSATARKLSICELLATTVVASIARLFLGSGSDVIGMSFNCGARREGSVLSIFLQEEEEQLCKGTTQPSDVPFHCRRAHVEAII